MSRLDDISREIARLRREVGDARAEAAGASSVAATAERRVARLALVASDVEAGWKRLSQDASPALWDPRSGRHEDQDFGSALLDRLAAGGAGGSEGVVGSDQASLGRPNLLLDPLVSLPVSTFTVPSAERTLAYGWEHDAYGVGEGSTSPSWFAFAVSGSPNVGVLNAGYPFAPFSSAVFQSQHSGSAEARIRSGDVDIAGSSGAFTARFIAGRISYAHLFADGSAPSLKELTIELYDATSAVVRASQTISILSIALGTLGWLDVNYQPTDTEKTHDWQLRWRMKTTGGSGGNFYTGDPMLVYSTSGSVPDYQPKLGRATSFPRLQHHNPIATRRTVIEAFRQTAQRFELYDDGAMEWGAAGPDVGLARQAVGLLRIDDADIAEGSLGAVGDLIPALDGGTWAFTYNGDGTVATADRSGPAGVASTVITYAGSEVASIVTTKAGLTITSTPGYTAGKIVSLVRAVV